MPSARVIGCQGMGVSWLGLGIEGHVRVAVCGSELKASPRLLRVHRQRSTAALLAALDSGRLPGRTCMQAKEPPHALAAPVGEAPNQTRPDADRVERVRPGS